MSRPSRSTRARRPAALLALVVALSAPFTAHAQAPRAEPTLAQAERLTGELKQGMSSDDVRKLLGAPRRTALRSEGSSMSDVTNSRLQWTYVWNGVSGPGTLRVDFRSKATDAWTVTSWEWTNF